MKLKIYFKGIKYSYNRYVFKLNKNVKILNILNDNQGEMKLDYEDHSISFSFNKLTTPESDGKKTYMKL